ncbi:undecaprenyl-diphosphate phosphatase [Planctomonas sp. JC2975]|uniref:undecaprenyl-diphosphate phosphatase n=1 Tax=Planctomonas sp. JC2975 TaxID=2729626 RepID=UPI0014737528|nr:undecaprenyl-diphosphate phosphatase [Planctomonas sp. JC2975]NNC10459.1 undecaprenyl-diphosphate phosphatase [Planctomonas sp. JC2975]
MDFVNALILGLVQGLTEFLPISSSAHVRIVGELIGTGADPGAAFTAIIQLGTELAVLVYFWRDVTHIIKQWFLALFGRIPRGDATAKLGWMIIVGSIPIVILGLLFQKDIETTFRSLWIVAIMLIVFAIVLWLADHFGAKTRRVSELTWGHAAIYGLAQSLALIPGVSRSGGTISAGLFMGYQRSAAARYSFLLAMPAVFGSGLYELYKSVKHPCIAGSAEAAAGTCTPEVFNALDTFGATVVAFAVGLLVIAFFMRYISRHSFLPFVIYRIVIGVLLMILLATGVLSA